MRKSNRLHKLVCTASLMLWASMASAQTTPCDATISYPDSIYCQGDPFPIPTIIGNMNGVFLGTSGIFYADTNGTINLQNSTPDPFNYYIIQYQVTDTSAGCSVTAIDSIMILPIQPTFFTYGVDSICRMDSTTGPVAIPLLAGTFSYIPTNLVDFLALNPTTGEIEPGQSSFNATFYVTFTPSDTGCFTGSTDTIRIVDCIATGRAEPQTNLFSIYPVPNSGRFFIQYGGKALPAQISLRDVQGRVMVQADQVLAGNMEWNAEALDAGIYFLQITTQQGVYTQRVAIQR